MAAFGRRSCNGSWRTPASLWENFSRVIDRAILACKNSGFDIADHFLDVRKTIKMPKTAEKQVIEREEIRKLRTSRTKLMLDE